MKTTPKAKRMVAAALLSSVGALPLSGLKRVPPSLIQTRITAHINGARGNRSPGPTTLRRQ